MASAVASVDCILDPFDPQTMTCPSRCTQGTHFAQGTHFCYCTGLNSSAECYDLLPHASKNIEKRCYQGRAAWSSTLWDSPDCSSAEVSRGLADFAATCCSTGVSICGIPEVPDLCREQSLFTPDAVATIRCVIGGADYDPVSVPCPPQCHLETFVDYSGTAENGTVGVGEIRVCDCSQAVTSATGCTELLPGEQEQEQGRSLSLLCFLFRFFFLPALTPLLCRCRGGGGKNLLRH